MIKRSAFTLALLIAACSGGGGAKVDLIPVATELRPTPHGYSFANFAASASPEELSPTIWSKCLAPKLVLMA